MKNKCQKCGKNCEGEYCFRHKPKAPLKRSKIQSKSSISKVNVAKNSQMKDLFLKIWRERYPHNCFICNKYLGNEPKTYMFDHCLEKGVEKYKHLAYNKDNIFYLCLDCHASKSNGFMPEFYKKEQEKLKTKYNIL